LLVLGLGLESSLSVVWLIWFYSKRGWNRFFVIDFRIEVILIDAIVLEKNELEKENIEKYDFEDPATNKDAVH